MINLGDKIKDNVTGFVGIVTCRLEYLNGCVRICAQGLMDKDGKVPDSYYFDEPQVTLVEAKVVERKNPGTGGPLPHRPPNRNAL